ncbi:MAG: hypothetical protein WBJ62_09260, partial [Coriobacteriia bacterium]
FYSGNDAATVYGPSYSYLAPGDAAWGPGVPAVLCWKHSSWPLIAGSPALYISNSYYITGTIGANQWRWYRIDLGTIPANAVNIQPSGSMKVNSDNADRTWINGRLVGTDGEVEGAFVDNHEWATIQDYPLLAGDLKIGANYMDVVVRNYSGPATAEGNPTGFIYDFSATWTYDLTVDVDIKPGSDPSAVNWDGNGKVPIAVLGSDIFDVRTINASTVTMNGAAVGVRGKKDPTVMASYTDVNFDGYEDLVVQIVDTDGSVIPAGATEVLVSGYLLDGTYFSGTGDIKLVQ